MNVLSVTFVDARELVSRPCPSTFVARSIETEREESRRAKDWLPQ